MQNTSLVSGTVVAPHQPRVEVFSNPSCADPEGKTFLGVDAAPTQVPNTTTWRWSVPIAASALSAGQGVTATATDNDPQHLPVLGLQASRGVAVRQTRRHPSASTGNPYRFTGLNIYNANSRRELLVHDVERPHPRSTRSTAIGPARRRSERGSSSRWRRPAAQRDWSAFDHTLSVARAHGRQGHRHADEPVGRLRDQADTRRTLVHRGYTQLDPGGSSPTGTGSARSSPATGTTRRSSPGSSSTRPRSSRSRRRARCSPNAAAILKAFAADVSGLVKSIDPNHLVSLGTIGGGQCGAQRPSTRTSTASRRSTCASTTTTSRSARCPATSGTASRSASISATRWTSRSSSARRGSSRTTSAARFMARAERHRRQAERPVRGGHRRRPGVGLERPRLDARQLRHRSRRSRAQRARRILTGDPSLPLVPPLETSSDAISPNHCYPARGSKGAC